MSEETAQKLAEARAAETEQHAEAADRKRECLVVVAAGIPAHVEEIAKKAAYREPDVTKGLGSDGIEKFRAELAEAATQLASEVEAAAEQIKWPTAQYGSARPDDIHKALFDFLYGRRVDNLAAIVKRYGFSVDEGRDSSQHLIVPQQLYDKTQFTAVAEALTSLATARHLVASAKAEDDRDAVDSLWND